MALPTEESLAIKRALIAIFKIDMADVSAIFITSDNPDKICIAFDMDYEDVECMFDGFGLDYAIWSRPKQHTRGAWVYCEFIGTAFLRKLIRDSKKLIEKKELIHELFV